MARSFSTRSAKSLLVEVDQLLERVRHSPDFLSHYKAGVKIAASEMKRAEIVRALEEIPVEDLNKKKKGLRTTLLRSYGYTTVAKVYNGSSENISLISGIGERMADDMVDAACDYAQQIGDGLRVRLSIDNQASEATELVLAIAKYRRAEYMVNDIKVKASSELPRVNHSFAVLSQRTGSVKWMLSSKEKKREAENAYEHLKGVLYGSYGSEVLGALRELDLVSQMPSQFAWQEFLKDPIGFSNTIESIVPDFLCSEEIGIGYGLPEDLALQIQDQCLFPDGLLVTLRRYQEWGVKYALHQGKVLLGDEMGLGKTVQAIATMVSLKNTEETHFIVICPASVVENWCREISLKSKLRVKKIHGKGRDKAIGSWLQKGGVAVTTFETTEHLKFDSSFRFALMVVDEAHYVKNPGARRSQNVERLCGHARRLLFMTGTALENNVDEMVSLIRLLRPDIARSISGMTLVSDAPRFREFIAPVYYRRKRDDVLSELPELIESEEWCMLSPEEEDAYADALQSGNFMAARRVSWNVGDAKLSSKARRLIEILQESKEDKRKVVVFSFFLDTIELIAKIAGNACFGPINGKVSPQKRQEMLDEFDKASPGAVLVAQIQSGGTGLNIQSASVVVICEPQFKPSIENQAISRAYRMGQTRNVLVFRLLCLDTIDERMMDVLKEKQQLFDEFADNSVAAQESISIDNGIYKSIIEEEIARINAKRGAHGGSESESAPNSQARGEGKRGSFGVSEGYSKGVSVTRRAREYPQPRGGLLNYRTFDEMQFGEGFVKLASSESVHSSLTGTAVDYMTRFMTGTSAEEAFDISRRGAMNIHETELYEELIASVKDLDDKSIVSALKLCGFDVAYRVGREGYRPVESIEPDKATIMNVRIMVQRSCSFLSLFGPKVLDGLTFEGGYTELVAAGDGDFLTADTLWDFKVSKNEPTKQHTLQLLMYWRMGLHSIHPEYERVRYLGIYNPRMNCAYRKAVESIPRDVIEEVEREVIGYSDF